VRGGQAARSAAPLSLLVGGGGHVARAGANDDWGGRERGRAGMRGVPGMWDPISPCLDALFGPIMGPGWVTGCCR